jgi:hypothetical protein
LWANKKTPTFLRASAKTSFTRDSLNKNMYNANIQKKLNMEDKKYTKKTPIGQMTGAELQGAIGGLDKRVLLFNACVKFF